MSVPVMIWVLVIMITPVTYQGGGAVATQEFFGQAACDRARAQVLAARGQAHITAFCTPKVDQ